MAPPTQIRVLRIPADGSASSLIELDTCIHDSSEGGDLSIETISLEAKLGHVPDLQPLKQINSAHRDLFKQDRHLLYKCSSETEAALPRNKHFRNVELARVYGDALLFKISRAGCSEEMAIYEDMEEDSAREFDDRGGPYVKAKQMVTR